VSYFTPPAQRNPDHTDDWKYVAQGNWTYMPGRPPIRDLVGLMPKPWRAVGDSLSAWVAWKLGDPGLNWTDASYLAQYRPDGHFYVWWEPGRKRGAPLGAPEFLGHFGTAREAQEATAWHQQVVAGLGAFSPAKKNPSKKRQKRRKTARRKWRKAEQDYSRGFSRYYGQGPKRDKGLPWTFFWQPPGDARSWVRYTIKGEPADLAEGNLGSWSLHIFVRSSRASERIGRRYPSRSAAEQAAREDWGLRQLGPMRENPDPADFASFKRGVCSWVMQSDVEKCERVITSEFWARVRAVAPQLVHEPPADVRRGLTREDWGEALLAVAQRPVEQQLLLLPILVRQPIWVLPQEGPLPLTAFLDLLEKEGIFFTLTRKGLHKAHRKLKHLYTERYCAGRLPSQSAYPSVAGWVQLLSQQEYMRAAQEMGNCLWWAYWCDDEPRPLWLRVELLYYHARLKLLAAFDAEDGVWGDIEGIRGTEEEVLRQTQKRALAELKADVAGMVARGEIRTGAAARVPRSAAPVTAKENPMRKPRRRRKNPGRSTYLRQRHPNLGAEDNPDSAAVQALYAAEAKAKKPLPDRAREVRAGETAQRMASRYSTMKKAREMALLHSHDYPIDSANWLFWRRVNYLLRQAKGNPRYDERLPPMPQFDIPPYRDETIYDPREESIRAVARGTGGMFDVAVGKYMKGRSVGEVIQRSWERYQDPDSVIRKRQQYELMLGNHGQSGPYRVTAEPTAEGLRYFVWPLPQGQQIPVGYASEDAADYRLSQIYHAGTPPAQSLPQRRYTKGELAGWLPPEAIFAGRSGVRTLAESKTRKKAKRAGWLPPEAIFAGRSGVRTLAESKTRKKAKRVTFISTHLKAYRALSTEWHTDAGLMRAFLAGEPPPER
jgi:hypothetical protein